MYLRSFLLGLNHVALKLSILNCSPMWTDTQIHLRRVAMYRLYMWCCNLTRIHVRFVSLTHVDLNLNSHHMGKTWCFAPPQWRSCIIFKGFASLLSWINVQYKSTPTFVHKNDRNITVLWFLKLWGSLSETSCSCIIYIVVITFAPSCEVIRRLTCDV